MIYPFFWLTRLKNSQIETDRINNSKTPIDTKTSDKIFGPLSIAFPTPYMCLTVVYH